MRANRPHEPPYAGVNTFMKCPLVLDPGELTGFDVAILGAPMDEMVTNRPGARFGPRAIRAATDGGPKAFHMDLGIDPFEHLEVTDHGDAAVVPADPEASHLAIRTSVAGILGAGAVPIILGGDHSISYPNIAAVADHYGPESIAVVHLDSHADTAAELHGVKWGHGSPFRNLVDGGHLRGDRLIQIGLRGYWPYPEEWDWMRSTGVRWHRVEEVVEAGIERLIDAVNDEVGDARNVFLSVDIDVLDPAYAPGTGTPEPGGLTTRELLRAVRALVLQRGLAGMDVVEVSPPYDHAGLTALAAHRVILEVLSALAMHRTGGEPRPENP
ncbi:MAG: agmatinase [Actinomycetota bacterium]|nr:agmatinase [Actinomycetota bacterium]